MKKSKKTSVVCYAVFCFFCLSSHLLFAQVIEKIEDSGEPKIEKRVDPARFEQGTETGRDAIGKNQISLDVGGLINYSLSYARRIGDSKLSLGGGVGFAWELNTHSFERNIWEPFHVTFFGRYQFLQAVQVDAGPVWAGYIWTDDCSECTGTFIGLQSSASIGHRFIFFGPRVLIGLADDRRHGSEFGMIWGLQARLVIPWGK